MRRIARMLLAMAILLIAVDCSSATRTAQSDADEANRSTSQSSLITFEELRERGQYPNLYDVVRHLRPRWLRAQGPDTLVGRQGQVQVHMDGNRMGSVDVLRNLTASGVTRIEWLGPIDAAARFGLDHGHGAIIISTSPIH